MEYQNSVSGGRTFDELISFKGASSFCDKLLGNGTSELGTPDVGCDC